MTQCEPSACIFITRPGWWAASRKAVAEVPAYLEVLGLAAGGEDARARGDVLAALQSVAREERGVALHQLRPVALPEEQTQQTNTQTHMHTHARTHALVSR